MSMLFMYSADAENTQGNGGGQVTQLQPEPTSEKLDDLKKQRTEVFGKIKQAENEEEMVKLTGELQRVDREISAEKLAIKKAENDAKIAEERAKRVKLVDDLLDLNVKNNTIQADKKASAEDKETAKLAFEAAREVVVNELLARYGTAKPAVSATKSEGGSKGKIGHEIVELFKGHRAAGLTDAAAIKAIIEAGYSRGTTGAVVLAYQRQIGEKA